MKTLWQDLRYGVRMLLVACANVANLLLARSFARRKEIAVRLAMGARAIDVMRLVVRRGMTLALCGVAIGVTASIALTWLMKTLLFNVSVTDPLTFASIPLLLAFVALLACLIPARRAAKVDPMVALRYE